MTEEIYKKLAEALNARSMTYPSVPCDEFYAFAKELFTPDDAEIASSMPVSPVSAEELAAKMKRDAAKLGKQLDEMTAKGLVRIKEKDGKKLYEFMPLVPGIIELQFMHGRLDERTKRLAQTLKSYAKALKNLMLTTPPPQPASIDKAETRKVSVEEEIHGLPTILPYEEIMKLIDKTEYIAAGTCVCRHQGDLLDRPCDRPKDNLCMIFGPSAQFAQDHGFVRLLSKEEARQRIDEAEKAGLVHNYANSHDRYIDLMCNCCGCHCFILRGLKRAPVPSQLVNTDWVIAIDNDNCLGCGACIDRCWMEALKMEGDIAVSDAKRCIGCGLCRYVCPTEAMKLVAREKAPVKS